MKYLVTAQFVVEFDGESSLSDDGIGIRGRELSPILFLQDENGKILEDRDLLALNAQIIAYTDATGVEVEE